MGVAQPIPPWRRGPASLHQPRVARKVRDYGCFGILGTHTGVYLSGPSSTLNALMTRSTDRPTDGGVSLTLL